MTIAVVGQFSQHEFEENQTSREEGDGVRHGREVRVALLVRVLRRQRGIQLPGRGQFVFPVYH